MKKQKIIEQFNKLPEIENYSSQTIKCYSSALKLFLEYIEKIQVDKITVQEIRVYLFYCKKEKNISFRL